MTIQNKSSLQALFQTGDIPTGQNYSDFIDSCVNQAETSAQNVQGPIIATEFISPRVSATNANFTGTVSAGLMVTNSLTAGSMVLSGSSVITGTVLFSQGLTATGTVSTPDLEATVVVAVSAFIAQLTVQTNCNITCNISAQPFSLYANDVFRPVAIISAAGTTQGAASLCSAAYCRLQGVTDGSATGFALQANRGGTTQFIRNETAVSANLWPPTGGQINALGANTAFALAANTPYTVMHFGASAYSVK